MTDFVNNNDDNIELSPLDPIRLFFNEQGVLAQKIKGYQPRESQIKMSLAVGVAITNHQKLVVEAGTGTGKTYAYLVPAMLSNKKTIISTGTKHLQDQIYEKDIPLLKSLIRHRPISVALLKGRANYLCIYNIRSGGHSRRGGFTSRKQVAEFQLIEKFMGRTEIGDITQIADVAENSSIWPFVTSTTESCKGQECPDFKECFVFKARKKAMDADLVVINHHLFCADLALKQEGFSELLPAAEVVVIDEAHQLAETAGLFFSTSIGTKQLIDFMRDLEVALNEENLLGKGSDTLIQTIELIEKEFVSLRESLLPGSGRYALKDLECNEIFFESLNSLLRILAVLAREVALFTGYSDTLKKCDARIKEMYNMLSMLTTLQSDMAESNLILWVETFLHHVTFNATPIDISEQFTKHSSQIEAAWIFTSATLTVGEHFTHFCKPLGLFPDTTVKLESPFNYPFISVLYLPKDMPDPVSPLFNDAMMEATLPVLEASNGRAFILFTSHHALNQSIDFYKNRTDFPIFIQGTLPKIALIDAFRKSGNGILLGTSSFWEGVDVKGDALSCVIIAKLPFSSPGDPIEQARIDALKRQGGNPFMDYQLPKAVIALKQGVGRLIRDPEDHGVLMIADPRLLQKQYGKLFLNSLPNMTKTQDLNRVKNFFNYVTERVKII